MFAKTRSFLQTTLPKQWDRLVYKIRTHRHKRRLLLSVFAMYVVIATLVGYAILSGPSENSSAFFPAELVAALRLNPEQEFTSGGTAEFTLTLQNSSPNESIQDIELNLLSTRETLTIADLTGNEEGETYVVANNRTTLDFLAAGERATYTVVTDIAETELESISTLAKFTYRTPRELLNTETNREFLPLSDLVDPSINNSLSLGTDAQTYVDGQAVVLTLAKNGVLLPEIEGKLFVSNRTTGEVETAENCNLSEADTCTVNVVNLRPGAYSALFIDEERNLYSQIAWFEMLGSSAEFTPSNEATLNLPFGPASVNGTTYIYAQEVVENPARTQGDETCVFNVTRSDIRLDIPVAVNASGDCVLRLDAARLPEEGIYNVRLQGTTLNADVSAVRKTAGLLTLENRTLLTTLGKPVTLRVGGINDAQANPASDLRASLNILHQATGESLEINALNGRPLQVTNGELELEVPSDYFELGGLYSVFARFENGRQSDTIALNFATEEVGLTSTGILVDDAENLRIGESFTVQVAGVKDRSGATLDDVSCGVQVYTRAASVEPIFVSGVVEDGTCTATVDGSLITTSGPVLLTTTGDIVNNDIPQSRAIEIKPGAVDSYGFLNLEYEPARIGYANRLLLGPVTDIYGNTTSTNELSVAIVKDNEVVYQSEEVQVQTGFWEQVIPSSVFSGEEGDELYLKLLNRQTGEVLESKLFTLIEEEQRLLLPFIPDTLSSTENLKVEYGGLGAREEFACALQYVRSSLDYTFASNTYSLETDSCEFDYDFDQYRNNPRALVRLEAGDRKFHKIVENVAGDAANLFALTPEIKVDTHNDLQLRLHTSPLVDQQGLPVTEGVVRLDYNGKIIETPIAGGLATFDMPATRFDTRDLKETFRDTYLDLDITAKASALSVSSTNNLEVFLGDNDIATTLDTATLRRGRNVLNSRAVNVFGFATESCGVTASSETGQSQIVLSHAQNGLCYVQPPTTLGVSTLGFEEDGFLLASYDYKTVAYPTVQVEWCQESPCQLTVNGALDSAIEVTLFDEEKEYRFDTSDELSNQIILEQNGLNPLKDYPVRVTFTDGRGALNEVWATVLGEYLIK